LFIVVAVTGTFMFFHLGPGIFKLIHQWVSLGLVAIGLVHVLLNLKVLVSYLRSPAALVSVALGIILCVIVAMQPAPQRRGGPPPGAGVPQQGGQR
jgi:hypothetical protein